MPGPERGANQPDFQQVQLDFAAHIRHPDRHPAPGDVAPERMQVYVELFYNNIEGFLSNVFPVVRSMLEDDHWHGLVRDFIHRHRCSSPYFLEIPEEFLQFVAGEREDPRDPPWLAELCHYEWVELALDVAETELPLDELDPRGDLIDGRPRVSPLAETLGYRWPVHLLGPEHRPEQPPGEPTWLLVYRDRGERVRFMVSNAVTVRLLEILRAEHCSGRTALRQLAAELGRDDRDALVATGRELLEDLRRRDLILGRDLRGPDAAVSGIADRGSGDFAPEAP